MSEAFLTGQTEQAGMDDKIKYQTDFLNTQTTSNAPWLGATVSSGTQSMSNIEAEHPGVTVLNSSTTANSGYYIMTANNAFVLAEGLTAEFIFKPEVAATITIRLGFFDTTSITLPTDGLYFEIFGGVVSTKARLNAVETASPTTAVLSNTLWYHSKIEMISNTEAQLKIWECISGSVVLNNTISTNIPNTSGRAAGHGVVATNSGTTIMGILSMDYMCIYYNRPLIR